MAEKLYDVWARRNPNWEKRYEKSIIKNFSDYGKGVTNLGDAKGKLFGADTMDDVFQQLARHAVRKAD